MRVVVVGASGNVGTAVLRRLRDQPEIDDIGAVARRVPEPDGGESYARAGWHSIDVGREDAVDRLVNVFAGATAVIHLAWQIQPSHDRAAIRRTNVDGTAHVAEAAVRASVPSLIVASSVGAYGTGPKDRAVDEDWPVTGVPGSTYGQDKADVEALLTLVEMRNPSLRVVRLRPGLTFQAAAASEIARLFLGPLVPVGLLRFGRLPVLPAGPRLRVQAVHADDVAEAYARAVLSDVRGAFNIAADPVLDAETVAGRLHARPLPVPLGLLLGAAALTWYGRLQPTEPGWIRLAAGVPLMSCERARRELGWRARTDACEALIGLLAAMGTGDGDGTAPLRRRPPVYQRLAGLRTGRLPGHGDPY